jgi:hypothetical protein
MVTPSKSSSILSINFFGSNDTNFAIMNLSTLYLILTFFSSIFIKFSYWCGAYHAKWKFDFDCQKPNPKIIMSKSFRLLGKFHNNLLDSKIFMTNLCLE